MRTKSKDRVDARRDRPDAEVAFVAPARHPPAAFVRHSNPRPRWRNPLGPAEGDGGRQFRRLGDGVAGDRISALLMALTATVVSYGALVGYDLSGLRYVGARLP